MIENFSVFDFTLSAKDIKAIETLDTGQNLIFRHDTPEAVETFVGFIRDRGI
jgi:diketogulonate reductase-like aldo/keto reductase